MINTLKILIADDHEIVRKRLKQILLEGFPLAVIEEVEDARALLEEALRGDYDIIISDLSMPGGGGIEALKHIRLSLPEMPVLIISIYSQEQYGRHVFNAGAAGFLNKDALNEELVSTVKGILSGTQYIPLMEI